MLLTLITVCAFAAISLGVLFLGYVFLEPVPAGAPGVTRSFGILNDALAAQIPQPASYLDSLDTQLARAGHYGRHARRNFLATRNLLVLGILVITLSLLLVENNENPLAVQSIVAGGAVLAILAYILPRMMLNLQANRRVERIERGLPDALDILTMCLSGGLPLRRSLQHVADEIEAAHPDLAGEMRLVMRQEEMGSLPLAFEQFARRTKSADVRSLSILINDAQRLGSDVREAGREQADSIRRAYRFRAEERASRAGAKLILPFVFCLLPAVGILLWAPALLQLRETIQKESLPGGAFSQDIARSVERVRSDFNVPQRTNGPQSTIDRGPFYRDPVQPRSNQPRRTSQNQTRTQRRGNPTSAPVDGNPTPAVIN